MVNAISGVNRIDPELFQKADLGAARKPSAEELEVRDKFQEAVAGTFFKQMLKALRSTQGKPAYFHGGQAEEIFQSRMDDQISEEMSRRHGEKFAGPLFAAYMRR